MRGSIDCGDLQRSVVSKPNHDQFFLQPAALCRCQFYSHVVVGTDSAGDTQTATISVTLGMQGPISIQVTPPNANMLVGGTQAFTAVDDRGVGRPDATWTVSDSTIASFVSGSPNTLMADAVGQVTLTATVGGVSTQTTVTVLSGTSLPVGTVLWSAPPVANFTTQNIIQAVPTADGPGFCLFG